MEIDDTFNEGFNAASDYFKPKPAAEEPTESQITKGVMALLECSHSDLSSYSQSMIAGYEDDVRRVFKAMISASPPNDTGNGPRQAQLAEGPR